MNADRLLRLLLKVLAAYYVVTGLSPLISMKAFEMITGPKTDDWLVHMVGLLAATIGVTLRVGAREEKPSGTMVLLAVLSAASFTAIDVVYALRGVISKVYLLDAALEVPLALALLFVWYRREGDRA